ncbi:IclR family transcriptional regulator [Humidisolicoccus flavus]|uniref:IclR family transcriptional regulator n=1 Tax=Humidisolicoccus flavus TaxID=3111414 RepID=UPI00324655C6
MTASKVPAAHNTLRILSLLASSSGPLPATMIASRLSLPRSTVYHLLAELEGQGFVMRLAEERRYGLGVAAVELSSAYARQEPLARVGRTAVAALVDACGVSAHLAVLHGRDVLYIVEERAPLSPYLVTDVNVRLPAHRTASGRAMLAALNPAQVRALYPNEHAFVSDGEDPSGIDRLSKLRTVNQATLVRGFAVENGDVTPGFASVGVAVRDHRDWPVAGLALTFRADERTEAEQQQLASQARATADEIRRRIYGRLLSEPTPA